MSHVHNIICCLYINKALTNQLVQHTRIEGTNLLTFVLKQKETHENYAHIVLFYLYIVYPKPLKKSYCRLLLTQ